MTKNKGILKPIEMIEVGPFANTQGSQTDSHYQEANEFVMNIKISIKKGLTNYLEKTSFGLFSTHNEFGRKRAHLFLKFLEDAGNNSEAILILTATILTLRQFNFLNTTQPKSAACAIKQLIENDLVSQDILDKNKSLMDISFGVANDLLDQIPELKNAKSGELGKKIKKLINNFQYEIEHPDLQVKGIFSSFNIKDLMDADSSVGKQWDSYIEKIDAIELARSRKQEAIGIAYA